MGPSRPELEELLRPTLDESADPARMRAAWSPWQLAVLALLGGPLTAGYLYGENFRRLGRSRLFPACVAGALVLAVACGVAVARLHDAPLVDATDRELTRLVRGVARVATVAAIVPLAYAQQRRFRVFTGSGGEPGSLWMHGLFAAFGLGLAGNWLVLVVALEVARWAA